MITKLSHSCIYVSDHEKALNFYVNKLGFKVDRDYKTNKGFRYLTITLPDQPDLRIMLMDTLQNPILDEESRNAFKVLHSKGLGGNVFYTSDFRTTYEDLKAKGVKFRSEPKEHFYGDEAYFEDDCGNWFSLMQPKEFIIDNS